MAMFHDITPMATVHVQSMHIHAVNVVGGTIFFGALVAHMPTLALYTAGVGACWYTMLAIREAIRSFKDIREWARAWHKK